MVAFRRDAILSRHPARHPVRAPARRRGIASSRPGRDVIVLRRDPLDRSLSTGDGLLSHAVPPVGDRDRGPDRARLEFWGAGQAACGPVAGGGPAARPGAVPPAGPAGAAPTGPCRRCRRTGCHAGRFRLGAGAARLGTDGRVGAGLLFLVSLALAARRRGAYPGDRSRCRRKGWVDPRHAADRRRDPLFRRDSVPVGRWQARDRRAALCRPLGSGDRLALPDLRQRRNGALGRRFGEAGRRRCSQRDRQ